MTARGGSAGRDGAIRFGTSGWRGVLGDEFTLARARAVVRGVARLLRERGEPARVVLSADARPGGARLVREAAAVLASEDVRVERATGVTATPVLARAVARRRAGAGITFTASHNPVAYQGLKVFASSGSVLDVGPTRRLERLANRALGEAAPARRRGSGAPGRAVDLVPEYRAALLGRLDREAFARSRPRVLYDALHGAGAGVLDGLLAEAGARVAGRRLARDARFGGAGPDPVPARLGDLARAVAASRGARVGLATDGDADRYAA
ncbi:MAG TPA: phosphoglucomutase/phosphomannomutase family protein, partial [Myxococcota bacterium]|nr:phosphoglucomutase/phosphomannomutase family protein [Myxococcota bacterium]